MRLTLLAVLALVACNGDRPRPIPVVDLAPRQGAVVARVGDLALTDLDVAAVAAERHLTPRAALDLLVRDALLAVEARRTGAVGPLDVADDAWRARVQRLLAVDVEARYSPARVPPQLVEEQFNRRHAELAHRGLRRVVHVVVVVPPDAGAPSSAAALARLQTFRDALAAVTGGRPTAAQFHAAAEAMHGGESTRVEDLEALDREGRTPSGSAYVPAFADAVWALDPAAPLSQPFATSFGAHVALLLEEVAPMTRTDDEARLIVRDDLVLQARARAARELVTGLRQRARVEIREAALRQVERLARGGP